MLPLPCIGRRNTRPALRKRCREVVVVLLLALIAFPAWSAPPPEGFADLVDRVKASVVNIAILSTIGRTDVPPELRGTPFGEFLRRHLETPDGDGTGQVGSLGSGFLIDPSGYVVTNGHVAVNAERIQVTLSDGRRFAARLVGVDPETDIAVLKIEAPAALPFAVWGDSDRARVGDWVVAVGNPFGLGGTVTAGILSARARDIQIGHIDDYLQVDAPINRGNSGGPLFDRAGQVIGINSAIYSASGGSIGIGFAVPSSIARPVVEALRRHGRVDRGWLGVDLQPLTPEIAESLGLASESGALILDVDPDSPAAAAGLSQGDVIRSIAGRPIDAARDLLRRIGAAGPDKAVTLDVWRDGRALSLTVVLGSVPGAEPPPPLPPARRAPEPAHRAGSLGMALVAIEPAARERWLIPDDMKGVLVVDVTRGSPAAEAGILPGDVIIKASRKPVAEPRDVEASVTEAKRAGRGATLLLIYRGGDAHFVGVWLPRA